MKSILVLIGFAAMQSVAAQDRSYSTPGNLRYSEKQMPSSTVDEDWAKIKQPVMVSFASDNIRYDKTQVPEKTIQSQWNATGWKGEKVHTQILIWCRQPLQQITCAVGKLANSKGQAISPANITTGFVRYVITDEFAGGCGYRKPADFDSSLVADAIDITPVISVEPNTVQPIWLSIQIPRDAAPGLYTGSITVAAGKSYTLQYSINVVDRSG